VSRKFNKEDIERFHDYGIYIPNRVIYMGSESYDLDSNESGTNGLMAERILKNLTMLDTLSQEPITIILNNIGGDFYHGLAIFDAIQTCKSPVTIKVFGHAMSMGSVILQAADRRVMAANAKQMIHYGTCGMNSHAKTFQKWAKEYERLDSWMEDLYFKRILEKHPDFPISKLKKMLDHDSFLTAQESVDLGLADELLKVGE
jgi:ATP-dependent Clp endopeptidase proteolytic subunit ClpP